MKKQLTRISNKLTKTRVLLRSPELRRHIPVTRKMDQAILLDMLGRYKMVYIKPCCGSLGQGVIRVERYGDSSWRYQAGTVVRKFKGYRRAYQAIHSETQGKPYLAQKGVRLLAYKGRPFDIRVMVQRNLKGAWEATGLAGRVAHPRKVVTNGSQGGTIFPAEVLLNANTSSEKSNALIAEMKRIGVKCARQLATAYPGLQEIGVDIAIDRHFKLWILEVNTAPDPCPFTKLPDSSMLQRIIKYGKAHGRTYNLKCMKSRKGMG
ncbi:YheC/YheD family protein [Paenibacillus sp. PK3_47]|uniref:YheC/YheD family protein n=1 Tax=Paenibacillus sp. PK3_47 TaxID=2072642 RepID=UPI00201D9512|nr:YheC/YheD family protein [Paenibacillus sp. PK3_47]